MWLASFFAQNTPNFGHKNETRPGCDIIKTIKSRSLSKEKWKGQTVIFMVGGGKCKTNKIGKG